ncbi:MAG: sodium:solute symporter family protein [Holosporales bacterium]|jgi:SSS family solute:Na+ symporter|nr:sodium:solute symporter family protein [Holosporales bacterium]
MDVDLVIVGLYLVLTLGFGIWSGRDIWTIRDFAVDPGRTSTVALYATIFATYIGGGSTIGMAEKAFSSGLIFPLIYCLGGFNLLFIALFVAPKMEKYLGNVISPGGLARVFWGRAGELTTGVMGLLSCIGGVAGQISGIGYVFQHLVGISFEEGAFLGFGMLVIYSAFGGIRAVVATDAIQYAFLIVSIPIVTYFAMADAGGFSGLLASLPADHLTIAPMWEEPMRYPPILVSFLIYLVAPVWMQRLLMGKDVHQLKRTFRSVSLTLPIAFICATLIGLSALATSPQIDPYSVMVHTIQTVVPVGFKGLIIAGLLAVLMSTADSDLNVAGVMLACDVLSPRTERGISDRETLQYGRWATFGLGIFALLTSLYFKSIIDILLYSNGFWCGTVLLPISASLMGYRSTTRAFKWGASVGGVIATLWIIFDLEKKTGVYGFFPAMIMNAVLFFGISAYAKRYGTMTQKEAPGTV